MKTATAGKRAADGAHGRGAGIVNGELSGVGSFRASAAGVNGAQAAPTGAAADDRPLIAGEAAARKTRVYIVDDHALTRRGLSALIGDERDIEVCGEADSAAPALSGILKLQPDVVVVDISLKGNSGLELIKNLKAHSPRTKTLVLSMHPESVYAYRALKAGARGYVSKHDDGTQVLAAIRGVRDGHVFVSESLAHDMLTQFVAGEPLNGSSPVASLTDRELEIMNLIGSGLPTREIAEKLHVSIRTVETHRAHLKAKLHTPNATQLVQACALWVEENHLGGTSAGASAK